MHPAHRVLSARQVPSAVTQQRERPTVPRVRSWDVCLHRKSTVLLGLLWRILERLRSVSVHPVPGWPGQCRRQADGTVPGLPWSYPVPKRGGANHLPQSATCMCCWTLAERGSLERSAARVHRLPQGVLPTPNGPERVRGVPHWPVPRHHGAECVHQLHPGVRTWPVPCAGSHGAAGSPMHRLSVWMVPAAGRPSTVRGVGSNIRLSRRHVRGARRSQRDAQPRLPRVPDGAVPGRVFQPPAYTALLRRLGPSVRPGGVSGRPRTAFGLPEPRVPGVSRRLLQQQPIGGGCVRCVRGLHDMPDRVLSERGVPSWREPAVRAVSHRVLPGPTGTTL